MQYMNYIYVRFPFMSIIYNSKYNKSRSQSATFYSFKSATLKKLLHIKVKKKKIK